MSRPIFSRQASVEVGVLRLLPRARRRGPRRPKPSRRIIERRVFYAAAWLDQVGLWLVVGRPGRALDAIGEPSQSRAAVAGPAARSWLVRVV